MVLKEDLQIESNRWEGFKNELQGTLEQTREALVEIRLLLEQSRLEVNKLAQRNVSITTHLQQIHNQFESLPRKDIRQAYDEALDAQQRLFVMRGQVEKLQSDKNHLDRYLKLLEEIWELLEGETPKGSRQESPSASVETLEMLIQAQEAERQRLSRQMHDGPAQALSNFILQTEIAMRLFDMDQVKAQEELASLKTNATGAFQQVRDFIFDLRPMMLDDLGLVPTLRKYVEAFKEKNNLDVRLGITGSERRFAPYLEVMVFRAVQELLGNAVHQSQANQVKVQVDITELSIRIGVEDNGRGFEEDKIEKEGGMGLKVIKDRVEMVGGYFDVSSSVGQGAQITFQVPIGRST